MTADWKTYRNEKYGYEIKYPKDWQLDLTNAPSSVRFDVNRDNFLTLLADWKSYYLALYYGIDPTPVKLQEEIKKWLKK
ncbi:MAG: hypothetical protein KYQ20_02585 [Candidatus Nealsonbacteria bacterium]|nr:hypothetical protein [Candidatus Nealsonbacteria bacterium]